MHMVTHRKIRHPSWVQYCRYVARRHRQACYRRLRLSKVSHKSGISDKLSSWKVSHGNGMSSISSAQDPKSVSVRTLTVLGQSASRRTLILQKGPEGHLLVLLGSCNMSAHRVTRVPSARIMRKEASLFVPMIANLSTRRLCSRSDPGGKKVLR